MFILLQIHVSNKSAEISDKIIMPKTKVAVKKSEPVEEEKIIEPDLVVPALIDEDALEEGEEDEDDGIFGKDELDPFDDKYEE